MDAYKEKTRYLVKALKKQRTWLRGAFREYSIVALVFFSLAVVYTNFVFFNLTTQVFTTYPGDGTGGFLWYNFAQPGLSLLLSPSDYVNYPYGEAIGGPTFITYLMLWLPVRVLSFVFGAIPGITLFMLLGYTLTALASYWLVKKLTSNAAVAFFAGFAVTFTPYAIQKSVDHIAYILVYVIIFIIAAFIGLWRKPTILRAVLLALAIALAFYTDGYYILLATVLILCLSIGGILYSCIVRQGWKELWRRIRMLLLAAGVLLAVMAPVAILQLSQGKDVKESLGGRRSNIAAEFQMYRSNVIDFLLPSQKHPLIEHNQAYTSIQQVKNQRSNVSENTNYLGYILLVLAAIGSVLLFMWLFFRRRSSLSKLDKTARNTFLLFGSMAVVTIPVMLSFMFSPEVIILGHRIPLPGQFFIDHDITLWRVMSRFFVPLHAIFALFAAISLWVIYMVIARHNKKPLRQRVQWGIVIVFTLVLAFEYATTINRPSFDFTKMHAGYYWLREQKDIDVIAELPLVDPLDVRTGDYVTAQIIHGKKILNFKENTNSRLINTFGGIDNQEVIDWAYQRGAQALITHDQKCVDVSWGKVIFRDENKLCIYKLEKPETNDTVYIKYKKGFINRPNAVNQEVVILDDREGVMMVTNDEFKPEKKSQNVRVSTQIGAINTELSQGKWEFIQDKRTVSEGELNGEKSEASAVIDASRPFTIRITPNNANVPPTNFLLRETIATNQ